MARVGIQLWTGRLFDDLTQIHDRYPVGDITHHGQVVGDQQITRAVLAAKRSEQSYDLSLHRDVQR